MHRRLLFGSASWFFLAVRVAGSTVNRTIDDQYGDEVTGLQVAYAPAALWSQGNGCTGCAFHPNSSLAHNGTWHDGSYTPSHGDDPLTISFSFNGTAVYIFTILVRLTLTDVNITLDGTLVGDVNRFQNVSVLDQYVYNVPILALDSIPYGEHTVIVTSTGSNTSLILFDYAMYTTNISDPVVPPPQPVSDTQSHHKSNVGAIVGGVIGGIALFAVCLIATWLYRRHRNPRDGLIEAPEPFMTSNPPSASSKMLPSEDLSDGATSDPIPSTPRGPASDQDKHASLSSDAESVVPLQDQLRFFRTELAALRSRSSKTQPVGQSQTMTTSSSRGAPISTADDSTRATSPLASEIAQLRAEVSELRSQQESSHSPSTPQSANTNDIHREITILRNEIEDLRLQQLGPLPAYSPPPDMPARRLPVAPDEHC